MEQTKQNLNYDRESYILIVDDDNTLLKFFKIHLNKFYSKIMVVPSAKEAVDAIGKNTIDLVLTDINMPRTSGLQLLKKIKRLDAKIPVVLVSGALLDEDQTHLADEVADAYIQKPFDIDELHAVIKYGLEKRDNLKKLSEFVPKNKDIRDLIQGKSQLKKYIKEADKLDEAQKCLDGYLKKAS